MNLIQEILNILERKEDKKSLDLKRDWFEFGRTRSSSVGNPLYAPKMNPHAIRFDNLKCNIISGLVEGSGTENSLPIWSTVNDSNCSVQTLIDSLFSQDAGATEGKVTGDFRVTGDTIIESDLSVLGTNTTVQNININGSINIDSQSITNITTKDEGLASEDNDVSVPTTAAVISYIDSVKDFVSSVSLVGTDLVFTGVNEAFDGSVDLSSLENLTSLSINANILTYTDENGNDTNIDLSLYLDDTNLARLVSGTLDAVTGIATFTRDDASTFTVDFSSLLDTKAYTSAISLESINQPLIGGFVNVGATPNILGFTNTSGVEKHYALTWTLTYSTGNLSPDFLSTSTTLVANILGSDSTITESIWNDGIYMVAEFPTSRTYTAHVTLNPNDSVRVQVQGDSAVILEKANLLVVEAVAEGIASGTITPL